MRDLKNRKPNQTTQMKNKILIGFAILISLLVITNPTPGDFLSFISPKCKSPKEGIHYGRISNYLIFSVYEYNYAYYSNTGSGKYYGVMKNFFLINN